MTDRTPFSLSDYRISDHPTAGSVHASAIHQHKPKERRHMHWLINRAIDTLWLAAPPIAVWNSNTVLALARYLDGLMPPHNTVVVPVAEIVAPYGQFGDWTLAVSVGPNGLIAHFGNNRKPHKTVPECLEAWLRLKAEQGLLTLTLQPIAQKSTRAA